MRLVKTMGILLIVAAAPALAGWAGSQNIEEGLKGRTDILGFEDFEGSSWGAGWKMSSTPGSLTSSTVYKGRSALKARVSKGSHNVLNFTLNLSAAGAADAEELYFRYYVYYPTGWVRDGQQVGKMPGFYGDKGASGCSKTTKGWSARGINADQGSNMKVGFYVYHADRKHSDGCGDSKYSGTLMAKNKWHAVEGYIKLNTPGQNNGILRQWINGVKQIDATGYRFRIDSSSPKVKGVWFHVYVGGSWTAPQDMECYFDNLVIARKPIGLFSGATSTSPGPTVPTTTAQSPFKGSPFGIPGTIQAEDFDNGGQGVAYSDADASNSGGSYRSTGVDIQSSSEGGYNVGWIKTGEWLEYTVTVATAGTYNLGARVASTGTSGKFRVEFNGANKTGSIAVPNTGAWQNWTTVRKSLSLSAGQQVMRVYFEGGSFNLNFLSLQTPLSKEAVTTALIMAPSAPGSQGLFMLPYGMQGVELYDLSGRKVWEFQARAGEASFALPESLKDNFGILRMKYTP